MKINITSREKPMPEPGILSQNGVAVTTENNVIEESDDDSHGFALSVDLSACVGAAARCRVWVRHTRRVRWLAARVRSAARLRGPFLMLAHTELLPPAEPLRVLRPSDTVRVERVENEWQRPFCFNDDSENSEDPPPAEPTVKKSHKRRADPQLSPSHKPSPLILGPPLCPAEYTSSPRILPIGVGSADDAMQVTRRTFEPPSSVVIPEPQSSSNTDEALQRVKQRALAILQQVSGEEQGHDDVDAPKKRRRRVRRRRPRPVSPFTAPEPISESVPIDSVASSTQSPTTSTPATFPGTPPMSPQTSTLFLNPSCTASDLTSPSNSDTPLVSASPAVCLSSDPLASPFPSASQTSIQVPASPLSPSTPTLPPASQTSGSVPQFPSAPSVPAWSVVRNQASARAPRVVRALGAGAAAGTTNATLCSSE